MSRKRSLAFSFDSSPVEPEEWDLPGLCPATATTTHCEPRLETDPPAVQPLDATSKLPLTPELPTMNKSAAHPLTATLSNDPTAHWGPVCAGTRQWLSKMELIGAAALTKAAKEKHNWSSLVPEARHLLYTDVKNVRDQAMHYIFLKLAPRTKQAEEELQQVREELQLQKALVKKYVEENEALKAKLDEVVAIDSLVDENCEREQPQPCLEEVLRQIEAEAPDLEFPQSPSPLSQEPSIYSPSVSSEDTYFDCSRISGPLLSIDEIEELLGGQSTRDHNFPLSPIFGV